MAPVKRSSIWMPATCVLLRRARWAARPAAFPFVAAGGASCTSGADSDGSNGSVRRGALEPDFLLGIWLVEFDSGGNSMLGGCNSCGDTGGGGVVWRERGAGDSAGVAVSEVPFDSPFLASLSFASSAAFCRIQKKRQWD